MGASRLSVPSDLLVILNAGPFVLEIVQQFGEGFEDHLLSIFEADTKVCLVPLST
jgi:hypothetical protein